MDQDFFSYRKRFLILNEAAIAADVDNETFVDTLIINILHGNSAVFSGRCSGFNVNIRLNNLVVSLLYFCTLFSEAIITEKCGLDE